MMHELFGFQIPPSGLRILHLDSPACLKRLNSGFRHPDLKKLNSRIPGQIGIWIPDYTAFFDIWAMLCLETDSHQPIQLLYVNFRCLPTVFIQKCSVVV